LKLRSVKIPLFFLVLLLFSCNAVKRVGKDQYLLTENTISVDGSEINTRRVYDQLSQEPNAKLPLVGLPLRLNIYNAAKPNPDSVFYSWLNKKPKREDRLIKVFSKKQVERMGENYVDWQHFKERMGEAPVIVDEERTKKSAERLRAWYWNSGWFDAKTSYKIDTISEKKAKVHYYVDKHQPYVLDSLESRIQGTVVDSLYKQHADESLLRQGDQFDARRFEWERNRLTRIFRNKGLYYFDQENITFNADTIGTDHKVNIETLISDREVKEKDSTVMVPFKVHRISDVNVFTNYVEKQELLPITDSIHYKGFTLYSSGKSKYKRKALTDAVFIKKGEVYKDSSRSFTYDRMSDIGIFQYPDIKFMEDPRDSTNTDLIANIFLRPRKKFGMTYDLDVSRSNIQDFGIRIGSSLLIRNVFNGLETMEIGVRGSIGSSQDASVTTKNRFFNISEIGADVKLNFPKIIFPFGTDGIIPKTMSPFTTLSAGISTQHNIGLDKQNLTGKFSYRWNPDREKRLFLNLIDLQYVRNLNLNNYFNIYRNSYDRLNRVAKTHVEKIDADYFEQSNPVLSPSPRLSIPDGAKAFINDLKSGVDFGLNSEEIKEVDALIERRDRLTENNLIFGTSFDFSWNTRRNIYDDDFTQFRFHLEAMGNSLALFSSLFGRTKADDGSYHISGVRFSQYFKAEADIIKHWDLGHQNVFAVKAMAGFAIPYGNSRSIPFVRSFFAGGSNDNRGWRPYDLGPGSSGGPNEFNEANMKLNFNAEFRFNLFGQLNSAVFVDVGNIWNVLDNVGDERSRFSSLVDLGELAVGSGFGLRYDFEFFVIRLDVGLKAYNPAYDKQKWFQDFNLGRSVLNVGINYPF